MQQAIQPLLAGTDLTPTVACRNVHAIPYHGDAGKYCCMQMAKPLKVTPADAELAQTIVDAILAQQQFVAGAKLKSQGPGFINLRPHRCQ